VLAIRPTIFVVFCLAVATSQPVSAQAATAPPVAVIVLENHSYGPNDVGILGDTTKYIVGNPDAPYINGTLIPQGTLFTNYYATSHPSLPNYLHMVAGATAGCTSDTCPKDSVPLENLFHLLGEAGTSFASYAQSMPANCYPTDAGLYPSDHNPETYLTDLDAAAAHPYGCPTTDQPFPSSWADPLPPFSFIVPDRCHGMEGTPATGACPHATDALITAGDTWLSQTVPTLLAQGAVVVVVFDEATGGDKTNGSGHVLALETGPNVPAGVADGTFYSHNGLLAGLENYLQVRPLLGAAATATPLPIPNGIATPAPTVTGLAPTSGTAGDTVTIDGMNLTDTFSVTFNGAEATFSVIDDSTVMATVPGSATTGSVTVTTPGGAATSSTTFTVEPSATTATLVQHAVSHGPGTARPTVTWTQTTTTGNLLIAVLQWTGSGTPVPPPGWSVAVKKTGVGIFYAQNAAAEGGAIGFTGTSLGGWALDVMEWSGGSSSGSFDRSAFATSGSVASMLASSGTTATTSQPVEIAIGAIRTLSKATMASPTNGFGQVDTTLQSSNRLGVFSKVAAFAEPESVSVTLSVAVRWRGVIATFRAS
jgi:phosphatidylinositol-3-phosphatase